MPFTEGAPALDFACTAIFSTAVSPIAYLCNRTHHLSEILRMSANEFAVAIDQRCFEDYVPGGIHEYGPVIVTEAEIIHFAEKFDPQYIHTDPQKAARGLFGGLIASGWHTASLVMRLCSDNFIPSVATIAPAEVDELRWIKPVRPGDSLSIRVTVLEARRMESKPQIGRVGVFIEVFNQHQEIVMTLKQTNLLRSRNSPR